MGPPRRLKCVRDGGLAIEGVVLGYLVSYFLLKDLSESASIEHFGTATLDYFTWGDRRVAAKVLSFTSCSETTGIL